MLTLKGAVADSKVVPDLRQCRPVVGVNDHIVARGLLVQLGEGFAKESRDISASEARHLLVSWALSRHEVEGAVHFGAHRMVHELRDLLQRLFVIEHEGTALWLV